MAVSLTTEYGFFTVTETRGMVLLGTVPMLKVDKTNKKIVYLHACMHMCVCVGGGVGGYVNKELEWFCRFLQVSVQIV